MWAVGAGVTCGLGHETAHWGDPIPCWTSFLSITIMERLHFAGGPSFGAPLNRGSLLLPLAKSSSLLYMIGNKNRREGKKGLQGECLKSLCLRPCRSSSAVLGRIGVCYGRLQDNPQRCSRPNPRDQGICNFMWQKELCTCG